MAKSAGNKPSTVKFISERSPEYRLEFVNGAMCNITPRGEIICDFHMESRDRPTEQSIDKINENGTAELSPFVETGLFTRDVKFGIVMNPGFARDLVRLLNQKIMESEKAIAERPKTNEGN